MSSWFISILVLSLNITLLHTQYLLPTLLHTQTTPYSTSLQSLLDLICRLTLATVREVVIYVLLFAHHNLTMLFSKLVVFVTILATVDSLNLTVLLLFSRWFRSFWSLVECTFIKKSTSLVFLQVKNFSLVSVRRAS